MAFVSAVGPVDPETGELRTIDIREQTRQCLENVSRWLATLDSSIDRVVWANWSLREPSEFDTFYEEWLRWFDGEAPVGQGTLMSPVHRRAGFRVSVGVIAATRESDMLEAPMAALPLLEASRLDTASGGGDDPLSGEHDDPLSRLTDRQLPGHRDGHGPLEA
jgi:2-iminobutanoate/2-iminopropanoate deaminase